jgi:molybdate transport system ATP-binding protein
MTGISALRARVELQVGELRVDVALDTAPGTLVVVGPNGAGKTSLLLALLGALAVERGHIAVGEDVLLDTESRIDVPIEARRLGYVPQDYALFPHLTVRENVEFALASMPSRPDRAARAVRADAILHDLDLVALASRRPQTLSGGEKQRVALARALSVEPRALLLDEPLAAFDVHARREVCDFLAVNLAKLGLPSLVVTHDVLDAIALGHRIAVLEGGRITQVGSFAELAARPASRFVEEFVASTGESPARRRPRVH